MNEKISSKREVPRESLEKAIPEIQKILLASYQEEVNKVYTWDEAMNKVKKYVKRYPLFFKEEVFL